MEKIIDEVREIPINFANDSEPASLAQAEAQPPPETAAAEENAAPPDSGLAEAAVDPAESPNEASSEVHPLQSQIDALTQEKAALYDQMLRRQAEFENFRKRVDRERSEIQQRARAEVVLEFLPIVDNFERALMSLENSVGDAEALRLGVELIHKQFHDALAKLGLQPVEAIGQAFDPNLHEAVTIEPTGEHEENTVIAEFQRGYKMGDRLLRPAKVKVASNPEA